MRAPWPAGRKERRVVEFGSYRVRGRVLDGETYIIMYPILLFVGRHHIFEKIFKSSLMLRGNGEVQVALASAGGIQGALHQVLLHGRADLVGIAVEQQQALGLVAVVEAFGLKEVAHHQLVIAGSRLGLEVIPVFGQGFSQRLVEGELGKLLEEGDSLLASLGRVIAQVGVEFLEHTGGGARGGHELHQFLAGEHLGIVGAKLLHRVGVEAQDAVVDGRSTVEVGKSETLAEAFELILDRSGVTAAALQKFQVLRGKVCHSHFILEWQKYIISTTPPSLRGDNHYFFYFCRHKYDYLEIGTLS